ncbi:ubiquitin carboxyl-terminal hydrolase 2 isoform X2 [Procambarus clarkii]|uniref:ubiquitin carboxyl-terminal hydrolase 2 isoform X2 n=1 Tax=Procambarus clarkii TaxID=6728 RepID=UPI001E674CE8|nr:ubiquitin carboxyl-terminal hydrolase 2-like isoform X2 [Procambarus clarkii]
MPVPPSTPTVGTRYPSYTHYPSYRTPSSAAYLARTTSLDRSSYTSSYGSSSSSSSYGSSYGSAFASKYSLPPRPSYSASSDTYRSSRSLRQSPVRPSYSRLSSDSQLESPPPAASSSSRYTSRYSRDSANRETSTSRDSGYSSRLASRDRSIDAVNGNGIDTSHFGPSPSSYACNYRWEAREKDKSAEDDSNQNGEAEKVRITDRIRAFETRTSARESGGGLLAGRESAVPSSRDTGFSSSRESGSNRDKSYLSGAESGVSRRRAYVSYPSDAPSRPSARKMSPEGGEARERGEDSGSSGEERRQSVTELCRKYDTNHNVTNGLSRHDDDEDGSDGSVCSGEATAAESSATPKTRKRTDSASRSERTGSPVSSRVDSPSRSRVDSPARNHLDSPSRTRLDSTAQVHKDSPGRSRLDSPTRGHRDSSGTSRTDSTSTRDGRSSPVLNGSFEKEGSPPRRHQSGISTCSSSSSGSSGGVLSENNGLLGLRNIGNTCFMNSVTQCLSNTRCLLEYLVRDGYSSDINTTISTMKGDLIRAFANLLSDMWNEGGDNSRALNTGPFKSQIQRFAPVFSGYQQHDAQEFLRKLLEGLHEDVNRVTAKPKPITEDIDEDLDDNQKAMESWKRYLRYDDSKIVDMFVGQLKSCLQCSVCGHCSVTFDPFWDLSLPIPSKSGQVRLAQCLDLFTKEEVLDGDERPTCSKCKERRKMTKTFSIQKFPKVFVLHLKRFSPLERWRGKLSCTVEFPLEGLNLSKYASSSSASPLYNLSGVANHSGTTYSGHYTAYCKHPYSGTWHEYNDSRVSNISPGRVCSPEAYVLFYELSSTSSKL